MQIFKKAESKGMKISIKSFYEAVEEVADENGEIPSGISLWLDGHDGEVYWMENSLSNLHLGDICLDCHYHFTSWAGYQPRPDSDLDWV